MHTIFIRTNPIKLIITLSKLFFFVAFWAWYVIGTAEADTIKFKCCHVLASWGSSSLEWNGMHGLEPCPWWGLGTLDSHELLIPRCCSVV